MNGGGFMHGGCVMTFADFCLFALAGDALKDTRAVTATFNGEFVGSAGIGNLVECTAEVVKNARSMVFMRGLIVNASRGGGQRQGHGGDRKSGNQGSADHGRA